MLMESRYQFHYLHENTQVGIRIVLRSPRAACKPHWDSVAMFFP